MKHRTVRFVAGVALAMAVVAGAVLVLLLGRGSRPAAPTAPDPHVVRDPFTTIPRDTVPVAWRAWDAAAFAEAEKRDLPIAVLFDASWCESCALYAGALAADPAARRALETQAIPVRVDVDRRPDIATRYRAERYGLPGWAFLSPRGDVRALDDAILPAALPAAIHDAGRAQGLLDPGIAYLQSGSPVRPPAPDLADAATRLARDLDAAWPALDVQIDAATPILASAALDFLEARSDAAARRLHRATLRRLLVSAAFDSTRGLLVQDIEPIAGRTARAAFLATQARFVENAARTREPDLLRAATHIADATSAALWDTCGLFRAAQGTLVRREGKPVLTGTERARLAASGHGAGFEPDAPPIYPTEGNARAAIAWWRLGGMPRASQAERVTETLLDAWRSTRRVPHDHVLVTGRLEAAERGFAADYGAFGALLVAAAARTNAVEGRALLREAAAVADSAIARFGAPNGAFGDVAAAADTAGAPPRMRVRRTSIEDAASMARFLLALAEATGENRFRDAARRALEAWTLASRGQDPWTASGYAAALVAALRSAPGS